MQSSQQPTAYFGSQGNALGMLQRLTCIGEQGSDVNAEWPTPNVSVLAFGHARAVPALLTLHSLAISQVHFCLPTQYLKYAHYLRSRVAVY